ncbi:hypothetical protein J559_3177 [Acinetobacter sp. 983759]|uniref:hypothetical protein n=1 Tax=Acinetobacter sp. 983759 TaxID=1310660 RepID=UPI000449B605|nr:hypothetical protein [Acinetobacter sp. 983759]EXE11918.1 hypothetical protein J559_3177 [Acinetobacter sp. 983759]
MNSAADLRRLEEQNHLQKAKQKVVDALNNDPMGLSIAQLMTVCRLSIKTVKNILSTIEVTQEDGVYFLNNVPRVQVQTSAIEKPEPEPEPLKAKRNIQAEILQLLKKNQNGLLGEEIIQTLAVSDKQFANALWMLKKTYSIQRTGVTGSFHYKLVSEEALCKIEQTSTPEIEIKAEEVQEEKWKAFVDMPVNKTEENHSLTALEVFKSKIKTVVISKSELTLHHEQVNKLLTDLFGLEKIEWLIEGEKLVGIHLSHESVT